MSAYDEAFNAAVGGGTAAPASPYDQVWTSIATPKAAQPQAPTQAQPVQDFSGNLRLGPLDTGIPLPGGVNKGLAQFGSGIADLAQGVKQRFGSATEADTSEKRKIDEKLNDSFIGKSLNFVGKAMPSLALPILGSAPVLSAAAGGALSGFLEPTAKGESPVFNTALGGTLGAVIPGVGAAYRNLGAGNANRELATRAIQDYGIPLTVADISSSRAVKAASSFMNDLPISGMIGNARNEAKQTAFNRAVGGTIGADADRLTPDVMQAARGRISGELNRVWNNNNLTLDGQFVSRLGDVQNRAASLNPEQRAIVDRQIQNLLAQVDANGQIPGRFVNNWQSELRLAADGDRGLAQSVLSDLRRSTLDAFNRGVGGADAAALGQARTQYGAFKTLEPLMNKAEAGVAGRVSGDVPAALLPQQVATQYGNRVANSPFADLSPIAGRFMVDRTPQTGGSIRALMQNSALAKSLGIAAGIPASLGQAALSPGMARSLLREPMPVRGLLDMDLNGGAMLREIAANSLRRAPIPIGAGLLSLPALE